MVDVVGLNSVGSDPAVVMVPNKAGGMSRAVATVQVDPATGTASASSSPAPTRLEYETVAASATDQPMGTTGANGDYLSHIVIQPTTTAAGTVTVKDGSTVIFTFTAGTLLDLSPKTVPFSAISVGGGWKITTGANVAVVAFGDFT